MQTRKNTTGSIPNADISKNTSRNGIKFVSGLFYADFPPKMHMFPLTYHTNNVITEAFLPNIYISTVITDKMFRHRGITKGLYAVLLEKYKDKNIFTRTWSTNISHTTLLQGLGFGEFKRLANDRGEGIDTVYYFKPQR